ncbi:MAG: flagellin [Succinivibrio sp.]
MAVTVQTNVAALTSQRNLRSCTMLNEEATKRLSSGKSINSAKDDPANLQISHKFTSQINCLDRGNRNSSEGDAVATLAENALAEDFTILQRIRQLAVQSANGTYSQEDRDTMQKEVAELCSELTRVACKTTYGGAQLLNGSSNGLINSSGELKLQVGANAHTTISVDLSVSFTMSKMMEHIGGVSATAGYSVTDQAFDISSIENAQSVLGAIDDYIAFIDSKRSELGALSNRLSSTITNQESMHENESDARARISDADYAIETSKLVQSNIMEDATSQMMMQANAFPNIVANLLA